MHLALPCRPTDIQILESGVVVPFQAPGCGAPQGRSDFAAGLICLSIGEIVLGGARLSPACARRVANIGNGVWLYAAPRLES